MNSSDLGRYEVSGTRDKDKDKDKDKDLLIFCNLQKQETISQTEKRTQKIMQYPSNTSTSSSNQAQQDLSFCIVWSPLPLITWFIPFIGHTGIADSRGVASDFRGPYFVGDDGRMAFGAPTRALRIEMKDEIPGDGRSADLWDASIGEANEVYRGRMHNIFCDNCHSHVSNALNRVPVKIYGVQKWNMVNLASVIFFRARFLSWWAFLYQFGPFALIILIVVLFSTLS